MYQGVLLVGHFIALDSATGNTVWQFKTGSSVNATAITYTRNGKQYVSIASGLGGGLSGFPDKTLGREEKAAGKGPWGHICRDRTTRPA